MIVAFVCTENSCRSQMAEALAKHFFSGHRFVSAGTHPAKKVDEGAVQVLREQGIAWSGQPKSLNAIGKPDILVTMGCDVVCPSIPGVKTVEWDIPDPKGKDIQVYREVLFMIKKHLQQLLNDLWKVYNL